MGEFLLLVVDCDPQSWSSLSSGLNFPEFSTTLLCFLSAFTCIDRRNRVAVLGYNGIEGGYLLLPSDLPVEVADHMRPASFCRQVEEGLRYLRFGEKMSTSEKFATLPPFRACLGSLTSCLCLASCFLSARKSNPIAASSRVLCFQASQDNIGQYIAYNNAIQCIRHLRVRVDSLVLCSTPSVFLQQAAHETDGLHLAPSEKLQKGLLQYLYQLLLPSAEHRSILLLPSRSGVNLKALCVCHKRFVSTAFMCTVCLSLWCSMFKECPACCTTKVEDETMAPTAKS